MSEARDRLERYLERIGLSRPADSAQQFQVTLMRQWAEHLDEVLERNLPDWPEIRHQVIREFIYGAVPTAAEADIRQEMHAYSLNLLQGGSFPRVRGGDVPQA